MEIVGKNREAWERREVAWESDSQRSHRSPWEAMREHGMPWGEVAEEAERRPNLEVWAVEGKENQERSWKQPAGMEKPWNSMGTP